jgi:hypothetical protein
MRIPTMILAAASSLALGGCAYGDLGGLGYGSPYYGSSYGYGSPYYGSSYGYGSPYVSVGYSSGYGGYGGYGYGSGYGYPYGGYGGYGSYGGLGSPYGWYDNYYYPGTGYYVYDSARRAYPMSTTQRRYW